MIRRLLPGYMSMGQTGMTDIATSKMPVPVKGIQKVGGHGPLDDVTLGGMFTIFKVREGGTEERDPGWYSHPQGTVADSESEADLTRAGIDPRATPPR